MPTLTEPEVSQPSSGESSDSQRATSVTAAETPHASELTKVPKRPRVQLDFTPAAYTRLQELAELGRQHSLPDLFRDALRIYEWYLVRRQEGYTLQIVKNGKATAVDLGL